jgi:hypothetical protein
MKKIVALAIEHIESSSPPAFKLTRLSGGKSVTAAAIASPYEFAVESQPNSNLINVSSTVRLPDRIE